MPTRIQRGLLSMEDCCWSRKSPLPRPMTRAPAPPHPGAPPQKTIKETRTLDIQTRSANRGILP